jgi:O-antigen/teichoic acid export membrane protein
LSLYKNLFKQTAIYGLASVLPRMFSFLLVPLYTDLLPKAAYGKVTIVFAWMIFFNVILAYGMETTFFRFYNKEPNKKAVIETTTVSLFWSTLLFLCLALLLKNHLANWSGIDVQYIIYTIWILVLDALVIVPFSKLRAYQRPVVYAIIKIGNVLIYLSLNVFFLLYLPKIAQANPDSFLGSLYTENFEIGYIFVSNIIASLLTFIALSVSYTHLRAHETN